MDAARDEAQPAKGSGMSDHGYPDTTTFPRVRNRVPGGYSTVTERQRISKAVRGLPWQMAGADGHSEVARWLVDLDAVLEIIDGKP